ncbi:MAG: O-antigen ligase family protein, partial [Candidatus Omnitrophica bacterium]|nr:O-antigen ligase family protein [Candidatus Omnitrophota bacterium]
EFGKVDRWVCWVAAMRMIQDRPVLGFGLNTFMANYLDYWVGGERNPRYAHNCYLQMAAETGYIGLTAFLLLLGFLFVRIVSGWRQASPPQQVLLAGCMAGLMAFAVQAGIDTNFYSLRQAALFWVIAGLAVGLSVRSEARPEA